MMGTNKGAGCNCPSLLKMEWLALVEVENVSDVKRGACEGL